jgi:hypothetical protein
MPAAVSDVRFACVESTVTKAAAPVAAPLRGGAPLAATNRLGEPSEPAIVTRAQWGADEAYRAGPPSYGVVRCAFVHHTVSANTYTRAQAPALVRGIYYYHTQVNGWRDIGYNFLIDRFGTIYEGRYGGVTRAVIGAQVLGFNSMSTGVALIGTFDSVAPSPAAMASLEQLLAWKLDLSHLDPLGTASVECLVTQKYRAGQWVTIPVISGHRQVNFTDCPGTVLFGLLPTIRVAVAGIGDPKIYTPAATPAAFSPNGDGVSDTDTLQAALSGSDDWTIALSDASGSVVAQFSGSGPVARAVWDGRDSAGQRLPDATYTATFTATSANGTARPASVAVRIDTVSPAITSLNVTPGESGHHESQRHTRCDQPERRWRRRCRRCGVRRKRAVQRELHRARRGGRRRARHGCSAGTGRRRAFDLGRKGELGRRPRDGGRRRLHRGRAGGRRGR